MSQVVGLARNVSDEKRPVLGVGHLISPCMEASRFRREEVGGGGGQGERGPLAEGGRRVAPKGYFGRA